MKYIYLVHPNLILKKEKEKKSHYKGIHYKKNLYFDSGISSDTSLLWKDLT